MSNNSFTFGLISGSIGSFVVYPIDVVKTRMQNQNNITNKLYKNGFDCCKKLWQQNKIKSFYKGIIPQILGVAPEKAVKFYIYNKIITNFDYNNIYTHILGGCLGGAGQVLITNPYEIIKINLQMNNKINYSQFINIKKLYTGSFACLLRDIPFAGIYFPIYWYFKDIQKINPFISGLLGGIPAAFLCTPADVIKTRLQTIRKQGIIENIKILPTIKKIYLQEGFMAFWKGGGWRVIRSSPQFGITLLVYESLNKL